MSAAEQIDFSFTTEDVPGLAWRGWCLDSASSRWADRARRDDAILTSPYGRRKVGEPAATAAFRHEGGSRLVAACPHDHAPCDPAHGCGVHHIGTWRDFNRWVTDVYSTVQVVGRVRPLGRTYRGTESRL